jgi:hypothetical protein
MLVRIERFAHQVPPSPDAFHRKLCRIMINAHIHETLVMHQIIHPIRKSFPIGERNTVVDVNGGVFFLCLPFSPVVLKIAKEFLLLAVHPRSWDGLPLQTARTAA